MSFWQLLNARIKARKAANKFKRIVENSRRKSEGKEPILTKKARLKKFFSKIYPPFKGDFTPENCYQRFFVRGTRENTIFRLIRNIVLLETFGLVMYFVLAFKYSEDPGRMGTMVSLAVHGLLSVMFVFPKLMYYFLLSTHRMLSSKIKTLLVLIILTIAFEVPAMNALNNIHRVAEGVACVQSDVSESLGAVDENIANHGKMAVNLIRNLIKRLAQPVNFFKGMLRKLDTKVTRVVEVIRQTWSQLSQLTNKCKKMMRGPYLVCLNKFHEAYIFCMERERNLGTDACGAIQRANKICDVGKAVADSVCNFPGTVKNGITEGVVPYFKQAWKSILKKVKAAHFFKIKAFKDVVEKGKKMKKEVKNLGTLGLKVEAKHSKKNHLSQLKENLKKSLNKIISTYRTVIKVITTTIHWALLPITLLWPFFSTALFVYKYNYREDYKNVYITSEFIHIDDDCALKGHSKLLPLNLEEKTFYVNRSAWKMTAKEKKKFLFSAALVILAMATPTSFVLLDIGTYTIINGVYEVMNRTKIEFPAHYELKIAGNNQGARMLNSLLETFSPITNGIKERDERWRKCFKEPMQPNVGAVSAMVVLFIAALVLCRLQVWLERQTLALADYCYPDRVRPRALMLYNRMLQNRKHLMMFVVAKQRAILADDQLAGKEQLVRRALQSRGFLRSHCTKCKTTQLRLADEANTRICIQCGAFYCIRCFSFTHFCLDCEGEMQIIDRMELYYEELSEDEESEEEDEEEEEEENSEQLVTARGTPLPQEDSSTVKQSA